MDAFLDLLDGVLDAAMMLLALTILVALIANYAISMREEIELITHRGGLLDPQALSRQHAFVINDQGQPSRLNTVLSP